VPTSGNKGKTKTKNMRDRRIFAYAGGRGNKSVIFSGVGERIWFLDRIILVILVSDKDCLDANILM
jgi:hypothetical protein